MQKVAFCHQSLLFPTNHCYGNHCIYEKYMIHFYDTTQQHSAAPESPLFKLEEFCILLVMPFVASLISVKTGFTDTLIGVGCVRKTGNSLCSMLILSGPRMPFPIQIKRILSGLGAVSSSSDYR